MFLFPIVPVRKKIQFNKRATVLGTSKKLQFLEVPGYLMRFKSCKNYAAGYGYVKKVLFLQDQQPRRRAADIKPSRE